MPMSNRAKARISEGKKRKGLRIVGVLAVVVFTMLAILIDRALFSKYGTDAGVYAIVSQVGMIIWAAAWETVFPNRSKAK
jgi:hypothetical protein